MIEATLSNMESFLTILRRGPKASLGPHTKLVGQVASFEDSMQKLDSDGMKGKTAEFRKRLEQGEDLEHLLPEAFALVREVARRTLGQRHYDVQVVGGAVLHAGNVAEMKTGEGKTLTATLAVYANALSGKGVHVVTVNDYLARRDAVWMGQIYDALGLSTGCVSHETAFVYDPSAVSNEAQDAERDVVGGFRVVPEFLRPVSRKEAYATDITYGTNNEFGFDYLRDNMVYRLDQKVQRGHYFAIVDEVDSILIDEARTPLIISAPDEESSVLYKEFSGLVPQLAAASDYEVDEKRKAVTLTEAGVDRVQQLLGSEDIYQEKGIKYLHHLEQALRAQVLFKRDRDYVVHASQVIIVDEFTGRLLPGRRYSGGLHQALEAKEGVRIQPESLTLASITFQNYFRMYEKLSGMTGTALTSEEEFEKVYGLRVIVIPSHKPLVRRDLPDKIYKNEDGKFRAVMREVKERHEKGQPVLVGTVSIEKNEYLASLLEREGVSFRLLNAKNHEKEAEIIAQAGRLGAVTVATNMAGRGVDIVLGGNPVDAKEAERVRELGGLCVIGTERHEARRIDNQLRGRSGRQGDPGVSQFFVSLEDDIMRIFGGDRLKGFMNRLNMPDDEPIQSGMVSRAIESAQGRIEGLNFDARKHLLSYDDVLNRHRDAVYHTREEILRRAEDGTVTEYVKERVLVAGYSLEEYEKKTSDLGPEIAPEAGKVVVLRVLDSLWVEHLENMEYLRDSVRLRAYGQQDPLVEYKNEGRRMFDELLARIDTVSAHSFMKVEKTIPEAPRMNVAKAEYKAGRNDLCPCGSGKKFKKCHGV